MQAIACVCAPGVEEALQAVCPQRHTLPQGLAPQTRPPSRQQGLAPQARPPSTLSQGLAPQTRPPSRQQSFEVAKSVANRLEAYLHSPGQAKPGHAKTRQYKTR